MTIKITKINIKKLVGKGLKISFEEICSYEKIYDLYITNKMSSLQIADKLEVSKKTVLKYMKKYNITPELKLKSYYVTPIQHDLIIGSILGDGTFCTDGNDYRMSFRQAENQKDYLQYKFEIMEPFCKKKSVGISDGNKKSSVNNAAQLMYYFHTRSLPIFNTYKKYTITEALTELNANSFIIWLLDDGTLHDANPKYTPYYSLSIKRFTEKEAILAKQTLHDKLEIECTLTYYNQDKKYYKDGKTYIMNNPYFPVSETEKIRNMIINCDFGERLKTAMAYKIAN